MYNWGGKIIIFTKVALPKWQRRRRRWQTPHGGGFATHASSLLDAVDDLRVALDGLLSGLDGAELEAQANCAIFSFDKPNHLFRCFEAR